MDCAREAQARRLTIPNKPSALRGAGGAETVTETASS
jgi:hypothetical protein